MNRRELIRLALIAAGSHCGRSFGAQLLAQALPAGAPSRAPFTDEQRRTVTVLADLIIPPTDTPGAVQAGVPAFIELMFSEWYTDTERAIFLQGLRSLDAHCIGECGRKFVECDASVQTSALRALEREALEYEATHGGRPMEFAMEEAEDEEAPFFSKLKELTVLGYYTSEIGAKQELSYNPMPGHFDGNYPFSKVGRQWSW